MSKASRIDLPPGWHWRFNHGAKRWAQCLALDGTVLGAVSTCLNTRTRTWSNPRITLSWKHFTLDMADKMLGTAKEACAIARAMTIEVAEPCWECRGCGSTAWEVTDDLQKWCEDCARPADWNPEDAEIKRQEARP